MTPAQALGMPRPSRETPELGRLRSYGEKKPGKSILLPQFPSCPGLSRASTSFCALSKDADGRDKPGHDERETRNALGLAIKMTSASIGL